MSRRTAVAISIGLTFGVLVASSAIVADWRESRVGHFVFWPAYLITSAFPPPCFDRGPMLPPFCEGTPVQLFAILMGLILTFVFYSALGTAVSWASIRQKSAGDRPAA
jgi:hypothetical protein